MFVLHPDPYLMPSYRISPFRTEDIAKNNQLPIDNSIDDYFMERFNGRKYVYTINGREALNIALSHYNLNPGDLVTILTTSGNFYISSCVTKEIEKFCKWNRVIQPETRLILVNHEFGYPYEELANLKKLQIPIIEDCAHSFFSTDENNTIGNVGDFVIYSFPKMFPIQIGGLLLCNNSQVIEYHIKDITLLQYLKNVLSHYIKFENKIKTKRQNNYMFLNRRFSSIGFEKRFKTGHKIVPGVFMFTTIDNNVNLPALKTYFYAQGIQSSVFYGEQAFFIPCHQYLDETDLEYFAFIIEEFLSENSI